jgi:hypothetical protein
VRTSKPAPVTKNGITVEKGQVWESLHPRDKGRRITVSNVASGKAFYGRTEAGKPLSIRVDLMHAHSRGWQLVSRADA